MNRVTLIGRLTADIELMRSQSGSAWASFTLAVNRMKKVQGQPEVDFIRCKVFGKTAENLAQYQRKGSLIAAAGSIATGSFQNQQGQKVYTTDILVQEVQFLEPRKDAQQTLRAPYSYQQTQYQPTGYAQQADRTEPAQSGYEGQSEDYGDGITSADLPF